MRLESQGARRSTRERVWNERLAEPAANRSYIKSVLSITCMQYRILVEQDEDGIFVAECPALPGCVSQGKTREEAIKNIKDAIEGYLQSLKKHKEPIPPSIEEEMVEVNA